MAKIHSREMIVKVGSDTVRGTGSEYSKGADEHDLTEYGDDDHVMGGGLGKGTFSIEGLYDSTAMTGPRAVLEPAVGTVVAVTRQPEGAGDGLPQDVFNALLTNYTESAPVADYVKWKADFTRSGAVDTTAQEVP